MTDKNPDMTPEELRALRNKKEYAIAALRRKWQRGELTDGQVLQLESLGISKHSAKDVTPGYNDLATTNPELATQWHPIKNGDLTPQDVIAGSNRKVWWQCEKGHEWEALVTSRVSGNGCPYCANKKVLPGFNDLATSNPELAVQWQSEKNGDLDPQGVTAGSSKKVWWQCDKGHEWEAAIANRSKGIGCPYCSGKRAIPGINDLATISPDLAAQWHPTKNGRLMPQDVMAASGKKAWWLGECGHEWEATVRHRRNGTGCPYCSGHKVLPGYNDLATVNPELATQWHPTRNGGLASQDVTAGSSKKVWWQCDKGHEWEAIVSNRSKSHGCPVCARNARKKKDDKR